MKLSLFHKFSISILSICILGMAFLWLSTRVLFESSFIDYINKQSENTMIQVVNRLANYYSENDSWQELRRDKQAWRELASGITEDTNNTFDRGFDGRHQEAFRSPPRRPNDERRPLPRNQRPPQPEQFEQERPRLSGNKNDRNPIDLVLLDSTEIYVAGHNRMASNLNLIRLPIDVNGETVGYLLGRKQNQITETVDQNFAESLNRSMIIVLLFSLIFTLFVAMLLARNLSKPIRKLSQATHELKLGNYETRMAIDRSDEVGQLAEDFNSLAKTLDSNRHSQQRWIADISHELRTPLAVLKGELMAIEDGVRQFDDASLTSLINETDRFSRMVNDLYDLSRADAGDLDYRMEPIDLIIALEDSVDHFQQRFSEKKINLSLNSKVQELIVNADFGRMTQLISNLLENSLRYTDPEGATQITASIKGPNAIITFEDSLPGVPPSAFEKIFERLYRIETSRSRQHGGGGLGLALCKAIVEAHHGKISAEKSGLGGLGIKVQLPRTNITGT